MTGTAMKERVLLVDDEPNVLSGYRRGLRQHFDVFTAEGGEQGLEEISRNGPFAVIVADMSMPVMDGVQFLKKVKRIAPDSTRMMLTGNADQETAIQAVNVGAIFRFLTKPCSSADLIAALSIGVRQYELLTAEKVVLKKTLSGSIKLLTELISVSEPMLIAKAEKIRELVQQTAPAFDMENQWEMEMAAMLAPLGALTQPPELRQKMGEMGHLAASEKEAVLEIPMISSKLLGHIPRMENVARLTSVSSGMPDDRGTNASTDNLPLDMKVMKVLSDYVELTLRGMSEEDAFGALMDKSTIYDIEVAQKIRQVIEKGRIQLDLGEIVSMEVRIKHLLNDDILKQDVLSLDNRLLLSRGTKITDVYLARLNNYRRLVGVQEPLHIYRKKN